MLVLLGAQVLKTVWLAVVAPVGDPLSLTASYAATFSAFVGAMVLSAGYFLVRGRWRELRNSLRILAPLIAVTCLGAGIGILSGNLWGYFIADLGKFCALLLCLALFGFCAGRVRWPVYAVFGLAVVWRADLLGPGGWLFFLPFLILWPVWMASRGHGAGRWAFYGVGLVTLIPVMVSFCLYNKSSLATTCVFLLVSIIWHRRRLYGVTAVVFCAAAIGQLWLPGVNWYLSDRIMLIQGAVGAGYRDPAAEDDISRWELESDVVSSRILAAQRRIARRTEGSLVLRGLKALEQTLDESTAQRAFELRIALVNTVYSGELSRALFGCGFGATFPLMPKFTFAWDQWPDPTNAHTIHCTPFFVLHLTGLVGVATVCLFVGVQVWGSLVRGRGDPRAMSIAAVYLIASLFEPNFLINWTALAFFACGAAKPGPALPRSAETAPRTVQHVA